MCDVTATKTVVTAAVTKRKAILTYEEREQLDCLEVQDKIILMRSLHDLKDVDAVHIEPSEMDKLTRFLLFKNLIGVLYAFNPEDHVNGPSACTFSRAEWLLALDMTYLGFIKDTRSKGTTSVSHGVCDYLHRDLGIPGAIVSSNGGTGGIKLQVYQPLSQAVEDDGVYCDFEKKENGPNPNLVPMGPFKPKTPIALEKCIADLQTYMRDGKTEFEEKTGIPWASVECRGFMTGPSRAAYEKASDAEKVVMDDQINAIFAKAAPSMKPWNFGDPNYPQPSFFMPQSVEGNFELRGAQAMYRNLYKSKLLETPTSVIMSAGSGRGSIQWGPYEYSMPPGADCISNQDVETDFASKFNTTDIASRFYALLTKPGPGVQLIAVKSLFAFFYNMQPDTQTWLLQQSHKLQEALHSQGIEDDYEGDEGDNDETNMQEDESKVDANEDRCQTPKIGSPFATRREIASPVLAVVPIVAQAETVPVMSLLGLCEQVQQVAAHLEMLTRELKQRVDSGEAQHLADPAQTVVLHTADFPAGSKCQ